MNLSFSEIIRAIEAELKLDYVGGAIQWADEKFDGVWSKAIERFDRALTLSVERMDYKTAQIEGEFYKSTILDLLSKYKAEKKITEVSSFLEGIV